MSLAGNSILPSRLGLALVTGLWCALAAVLVAGVFAAATPARADGLALTTGALTLFVAAIVATFSRRYMRFDPRPVRFTVTAGLLVAAILGFVFTRNLLLFGAAWSASGWLLARLIGHTAGWAEARSAARRTLACFAVGDAALVGALALLGWHAGSLDLAVVTTGVGAMPPTIVNVAALLLLVAAAVRCALPPFSGWLLASMTAPTPVSALMHAGFVNAGGFLLIRFAPVLEAAPAVRFAAAGLGIAAALYGLAIMAVRPDIKRALAGSTVSQMGFMILCCALGAYSAALWHIVAHGLFKAWLFLGAGSAIAPLAPRRTSAPDWRPAAIAAALVAAAALLAGRSILADGAAIPGMLALATAAITLSGTVRSGIPARAGASLAALVLGLAAVNLIGLALAAAAVGANGPPLLGPLGNLAILAIFAGAWVWQSIRQAAATPLPAALYTHLLNAAALPAAAPGPSR